LFKVFKNEINVLKSTFFLSFWAHGSGSGICNLNTDPDP
jgi:hypothetical protein